MNPDYLAGLRAWVAALRQRGATIRLAENGTILVSGLSLLERDAARRREHELRAVLEAEVKADESVKTESAPDPPAGLPAKNAVRERGPTWGQSSESTDVDKRYNWRQQVTFGPTARPTRPSTIHRHHHHRGE